MSSFRYWRVRGLGPSGESLIELAGLEFFNGATPVTATVTSNMLPTSGVDSNLTDGNPATSTVWSASADLKLVADLGASLPLTTVSLVAASVRERFPIVAGIQGSDDGTTWSDVGIYSGIRWPGVAGSSALGVENEHDEYRANVTLHVRAGVSAIEETTGKTPVPSGSVAVGTTLPIFDGRSIQISGNTSRLAFADSPGFSFGLESFTIEGSGILTDASESKIFMGHSSGTGTAYTFIVVYSPVDSSFKVNMRDSLSATDYGLAGPIAKWPLNVVNSFVFQRSGHLFTLFVNGEIIAQSNMVLGPMFDAPGALAIGKWGDDSDPRFSWTGAFDEVRITKGVARYVTEFPPAPARFSTTQAAVSDVDGKSYSTGTGGGKTFVNTSGAEPPPVVDQAYLRDIVRLRKNYLIPDGNGRIAGTVKEKNTPANTPLRRRVMLVREIDGFFIAQTWSDATTGDYEFTNLQAEWAYYVIALDHAHNYRATAADNLVPEVIA